MTKNKMLDAINGIVAILEPLSVEERNRAISAASTVLGDEVHVGIAGNLGKGEQPATPPRRLGASSAQAYFDEKSPENKGEELAVAARYREENAGVSATTKDEFRSVLKEARRNFDDRNFKRDLDNARVKGLFNRGAGKEGAVLSYFGQKYVDALPDRVAVKALGKPKGARRKPPAKKA